jgi:8-oxo-dGTP pyrophosphatase MutT (NUDIX family)
MMVSYNDVMHKAAWDQIESIYNLPHVDRGIVERFRALKSSQVTHTKGEGNGHHICSFFLPYHQSSNSVYLCDHIKAKDWIPPGGHIEPGETPLDAAIREMREELSFTPRIEQLEAWNLSVKPINRPEANCLTHFDVWYLVKMDEKSEFEYDPREYHDAAWLTVQEGVAKIKHNPDFAGVISLLA